MPNVTCRFDDMRAGWSVEGRGLQAVLEAGAAADVPALLEEVDGATRRGLVAAGYVAYEAAPAFDRALSVRPPAREMPLAWFALFDELAPAQPLAAPRAPAADFEPEITPGDYRDAVARIHDAVAEGLTYQVNFTTRLRCRNAGDPLHLYERLAAAQHGSYHAYLETDGWAVACASPELFFERTGDRVVTRPMKGTAPRAATGAADARAARALRHSEKERAENLMVVDLLRSDLGRVAAIGSVRVDELFALEAYPTVWQLTSTVSCQVPEDTSLRDLFRALFPCGSVTGAPKAAAMSLIADLEASPRGAYCGAIGLAGPGPTARFAVGIRTAVLDRDAGVTEYGVGGGITWYAEAGAEWEELWAKAAVLTTWPRSVTPRHPRNAPSTPRLRRR